MRVLEESEKTVFKIPASLLCGQVHAVADDAGNLSLAQFQEACRTAQLKADDASLRCVFSQMALQGRASRAARASV